MSASFEAAIVLYTLGVGGACALAGLRGRLRSPLLLPALAFLELLVITQAVLDVIRLAGGATTHELATHLGYLIASLFVLPVAATSVHMDEGRWGSMALGIGCLVVAVVSIRLHQTLGAPNHA